MRSRGLIFEAVIIGIMVVVGGVVVSKVLEKCCSVDLPPACKNWNRHHIMEISLFFTGFFAHIFSEFVGFNKWYCKHGNACR